MVVVVAKTWGMNFVPITTFLTAAIAVCAVIVNPRVHRIMDTLGHICGRVKVGNQGTGLGGVGQVTQFVLVVAEIGAVVV